MTNRVWWAIAVLSWSSAAAAAGPADDRAIRALQQEQARAWNAHDINAYANLFTANAHVINVLGWHWRSRVELTQKLGRGFASVFAQSQLAIREVDVAFLKPDVAVVHVSWTMTGALSPTGSGGSAPQQGIQTQILVKSAGQWRIADFQNTNSVPELAFPPKR